MWLRSCVWHQLTVRQLGLNTPIRQGQTRYSYLVMQFTHEEEITAELNALDVKVVTFLHGIDAVLHLLVAVTAS